ncbi:hypothetical protein THIOM_004654 [Candidatus Thiomargarita nelsonii]|uniref:Uncharacterized protein n=1 Tax=Candidatus Thiomargarita nelsonii TaxID=1003181 RepID=A0A176RVC3_9GAMM|nr:hypothetical protein THIOM_004654 [Candidatus Thiomargarita nelsonii]
MQNVAHDGFMGDFSMIRMGVINGIIFSFTDIGCKGFTVIMFTLVPFIQKIG